MGGVIIMNFVKRIIGAIENAIVLTVTVISTVVIFMGGVYGTTVVIDKLRGVQTGSTLQSACNFKFNAH